MADRFFNTEGPCESAKHYMLAAEGRVDDDVERLIDRERYFVIHAPRQVGKTTAFRALARRLTAEGRYASLLTSCEAGQSTQEDLDGSVDAVITVLQRNAALNLPPELRPPRSDPSITARARLLDLLGRWAQQSPLPLTDPMAGQAGRRVTGAGSGCAASRACARAWRRARLTAAPPCRVRSEVLGGCGGL